MPTYDAITYSTHAPQRMRMRRLSREDVELVLRIGEGHEDDDGTINYELDRLAVEVVERGDIAHVVTVMRLRKRMNATLTCDPDVKALYIQVWDTDVLETMELAKGVYLDIDADGQAVGFEILNANAGLLASIPALPETADLAALLKPWAA